MWSRILVKNKCSEKKERKGINWSWTIELTQPHSKNYLFKTFFLYRGFFTAKHKQNGEFFIYSHLFIFSVLNGSIKFTCLLAVETCSIVERCFVIQMCDTNIFDFWAMIDWAWMFNIKNDVKEKKFFERLVKKEKFFWTFFSIFYTNF